MKYVFSAYYLFFLLSGGFRHYVLEFEMVRMIENIDYVHFGQELLWIGEISLMGIAAYLVVSPYNKTMQLIFSISLLAVDLYFQNVVRFQSAVIMIHLFPIFMFGYLACKTKKQQEALFLAATLTLSIGFFCSALAKVSSGWIIENTSVIYQYSKQFSEGFDVPILISVEQLHPESVIWQTLDYLAIAFEASFVINFFTTRWILPQLIMATVFHVAVFAFLGITLFYPFILIYAFVMMLRYQQDVGESVAKKTWTFPALLSIFIVALCIWQSPQFFRLLLLETLNWPLDVGLGLLCLVFFAPIVYKQINAPQQFTKAYDDNKLQR